MAELEFHGAAQEVTGSMHLLHLPDGPVALDCGLFQGRRGDARQKNLAWPVPPRKLKAVVLSHAHMDHSGNIPGLVRNRFSGPVYATPATCDLCDVMLADSAKIQEEDARFWNERRARGPDEFIEPLYTIDDARAAHKYFHGEQYGQPFEFSRGCRATFVEAGHILGSACVIMEISQSSGKPIRLLYTGDLGRFSQPILRDPAEPMPKADYLITESTYAGRRHDVEADMKQRLVWIINQTRDAGGKVIIPAFSVGRTQTVVYHLSQAIADGSLRPLPVFVDSPLSFNATEVFKHHPECFDDEARRFAAEKGDPFGLGLMTYINDVNDSKALNSRRDSCVIIASSGMCEAGRVLHHLKNNIENEANTVIIVGFQGQGTLGRRIVERREEIKIFGRMYKLLCRVEVLNGFSAHADADDFVRSFTPLASGLKAAFVVHGEQQQEAAMKELLTKAGCPRVEIPKPGDKFGL
ncbi:MAG: MBL fold metallo-hydrolase [Phycisphaerae bacterium]